MDGTLAAAPAADRPAAGASPKEPKNAPSAGDTEPDHAGPVAQQREAVTPDRLAYARAKLAQIERSLPRAAEEDRLLLERERDYWRRVEAHEQQSPALADLQRNLANEKTARADLQALVEAARLELATLEKTRSAMSPQKRRANAATYRDKAEAARRQATALEERAAAARNRREQIRSRMADIAEAERTYREWYERAADGEGVLSHLRRMEWQLKAERQLISLFAATAENIEFAIYRQAGLARDLAEVHDACAEVLTPRKPSFWERQRKILDSVKIVAVAAVIYHLVAPLFWVIQSILVGIGTFGGRAPFSARRIATLASFAASLTKVLVVVFTIVAVFNAFGVEPAKAGGAIGLIGLIMAGMFQQIVVDFVKGADIVFGNHFHVGDFVELDGKCGHVVSLNIKHTRLRTLSGAEFNIPNSRCVPSRRFPDGFVDNYVDFMIQARADENRARAAIDAVCPDLNQRVEAVREEPQYAERFTGPQGRPVLRYRLRVLPGCDWVAKERFIPAAKESLADHGVELAGEPSLFFINRIETFRKLFSRKLTEEEIVRETAEKQP